MKPTDVPWSKLMESARAKKARERTRERRETFPEGEFEAGSQDAMKRASESALREAYEALEGEFVLDLDSV